MRFWRKKQTWQVIAALLFAVWILMGDQENKCKRREHGSREFYR